MQKPIFAFLLVALAAVIFGGARDFDLVWRDTQQSSTVGRNEADSPGLLPGTISAAWRPSRDAAYEPIAPTVRIIVHKIERTPAAEPKTLHLLSIVTHLMSSVFVLLILALVLQNYAAAFVGAMLFAVHPIQVDAVAYVSSFKFVLGTMFALAATWQFLVFLQSQIDRNQKRDYRHYHAATAFFALALLTDASTFVTPAIVWLCVRLVPESSSFSAKRRPFWQLSMWLFLAFPAAIWLVVSQNTHALSSHISFWVKPLVGGDAIAFYMSKIVVPFRMAPDYGRSPTALINHWWGYATWLFPAIMLVSLASWRDKASRWYGTAFIILVLGLFPFLGWYFFEEQATSTVANRFAYFAMLGPALAAAYTVSMPRKSWLPAMVVATVALCGYKSRLDLKYWHDDVKLWQHALDVNPTSPIANQALGDSARRKGDWQNARIHYQKVLESNALSADINYYLGEIERLHGDPAIAMQFYEKTAALDPSFADAHIRLGLAYLNKGEEGLALEHLHKAVALAPQSEEPLRNLGFLYAKKKDYPNAIVHLTKALAMGGRRDAGSEADTRALLGLALANSGQVDAAQSHLETALKLNPRHADANRTLADIYYTKSQFDLALPLYETALAQGGKDFSLFDRMAEVLAKHKEHARAVEFFAKALEIKPDAARTISNLGISQFRVRLFKEAAENFTKALALDPKLADPHYFLGDIARWQGKDDVAIAEFQKALRNQPDHPDANYRMGNYMMKEDKLSAAARYYHAALRGDPDDPKLRYSLQQALKGNRGDSSTREF